MFQVFVSQQRARVILSVSEKIPVGICQIELRFFTRFPIISMSPKPGVLKARVGVFDSGRVVPAISHVGVRLWDWNKGRVRTDQPWGGHSGSYTETAVNSSWFL